MTSETLGKVSVGITEEEIGDHHNPKITRAQHITIAGVAGGGAGRIRDPLVDENR